MKAVAVFLDGATIVSARSGGGAGCCHVEPAVSLTLSASGFQPTEFTGSLSHGTITGYLNGSGFSNMSMTLTRH